MCIEGKQNSFRQENQIFLDTSILLDLLNPLRIGTKLHSHRCLSLSCHMTRSDFQVALLSITINIQS